MKAFFTSAPSQAAASARSSSLNRVPSQAAAPLSSMGGAPSQAATSLTSRGGAPSQAGSASVELESAPQPRISAASASTEHKKARKAPAHKMESQAAPSRDAEVPAPFASPAPKPAAPMRAASSASAGPAPKVSAPMHAAPGARDSGSAPSQEGAAQPLPALSSAPTAQAEAASRAMDLLGSVGNTAAAPQQLQAEFAGLTAAVPQLFFAQYDVQGQAGRACRPRQQP